MNGTTGTTIRIKKLHAAIPESLFNDLRELQLLGDIDNVVAELLAERVREIRGNKAT